MLDRQLVFNNDSSFKWFLSNTIVVEKDGIWQLTKPKNKVKRKNDGVSAAMNAMFVYLEVKSSQPKKGRNKGGYVNINAEIAKRRG